MMGGCAAEKTRPSSTGPVGLAQDQGGPAFKEVSPLEMKPVATKGRKHRGDVAFEQAGHDEPALGGKRAGESRRKTRERLCKDVGEDEIEAPGSGGERV